jgi:hypothetical protein
VSDAKFDLIDVDCGSLSNPARNAPRRRVIHDIHRPPTHTITIIIITPSGESAPLLSVLRGEEEKKVSGLGRSRFLIIWSIGQ